MLRVILVFTAGALAPLALPALWPAPLLAATGIAAALVARRAPAMAAAIAGFVFAQALDAREVASRWPCARDKEAAWIEGRVAAAPLERDDRTDFDIDVNRTSAPGQVPRRIRLAWYEAADRPAAGETWRFSVTIRCPRGFANPGAQDRELSLLREGIDATGTVTDETRPERVAAPAGSPVERLRERIARAIADAAPAGPSVAVLQGLSVGVRGQMPDALWDAFAVTGLAHLMAISGLHVTGCAVAVLVLLRVASRIPPLARVRARILVESVVVTAVTAAYALLSGASVPALRTLAAVALFAVLRGLRRAIGAAHALAAAAFVLVACNPLAASSAGFWLSFVATAALFAVAGAGSGRSGRIAEFSRAQAAITILLAPILAASFGRLSLVAPFANAVAIPVFGLLLLPALLAGTVLAAISPDASVFVWRTLAAALDHAWPALEAVAAWPLAAWSPAEQPLSASVAAVALGFAALLLPIAGLRLATIAVVTSIAFGGAGQVDPGEFRLTVVDVGQGLAAVVEAGGHAMVFDAGPRWRGGGAAARFSLLPLLRARGIRDVDLLVVSHDDADHAGGVETLARGIPVARVMAAPGSHLNAGETCESGMAWKWGDVEFRVVHPPARFDGSDYDRSCALIVAGAGGSALLLADPEAAAEEAIAAGHIAADVVLLPHHGSRSSTSAALVESVRARVGIASAGFGNRWGMPNAAVVARWRAAGTTVLDTAAEGAITVRFPAEPGRIQVDSERRSRPHWWRAKRVG